MRHPRPTTHHKAAPIQGLGDVVHLIAQPIARAIDAAAKTSLSTCGGCAKRRAEWNQAFPFRRHSKPHS